LEERAPRPRVVREPHPAGGAVGDADPVATEVVREVAVPRERAQERADVAIDDLPFVAGNEGRGRGEGERDVNGAGPDADRGTAGGSTERTLRRGALERAEDRGLVAGDRHGELRGRRQGAIEAVAR